MSGGRGLITLAHGNGGRFTRELIQDVFAPCFANPAFDSEADAAVLPRADGELLMTTDGFIVEPLEFPGGDIGSLAMHGLFDAGLAPQDYLGALAAKEHAIGSPFGLATEKFGEMLHAIGTEHGVVMHVDEAHAEIVPTVLSINVKTCPGSMAAIAKPLNHMGAS